ncbi:MAG: methionine-R-sulfoxide reductase [Frankiales bacterium]|nr:methionine-R-sulfoxide reductase [Frankiales bacterium]
MRLRPPPPQSPLRRLTGGLSGERMALVRCAAGSVLLVRPRSVVDVLGGDPVLSPAGDWGTRMLGARELALGLGVLVAAQGPDRARARLWFAAGALSDAADAVVLTSALRRRTLGRSGRTRVAAAACTVGAAVAVAVQVRDAARGRR